VYRAQEGNIGMSSTVGDGAGEASVSTTTLDDLVAAEDAANIRFVKIDVEGDELRVLQGARRMLSDLPSGAAVLIEVTPDRLTLRGQDVSELWDVLPPDTFEPLVMDNAYSVEYYANVRIPGPRKWTGALLEPADMIFVKR
jgi:hypothetical protein